jgi:hypothetical protein
MVMPVAPAVFGVIRRGGQGSGRRPARQYLLASAGIGLAAKAVVLPLTGYWEKRIVPGAARLE